ncbi:MAG TPA: YggS family pyridoxal phosphate-dependent enzyme [Verrucomicrobiota bacterium]|nr:YggS family pyridoxal phosphate-dependent enzyme [Verrucomicrobiota bacterium]
MSIESNIRTIQKQIEQASGRSGRDPSEVTLVAVSKFHPWQAVCEAAEAGVQFFGESRVQEAKLKIPQCPPALHWHLVGHLQSNKCRDAVGLFEMIQSVDSWSLAERLNNAAEKRGSSLPILLEVNVAGEASKFGYSPEALPEDLLKLNALDRLEIHGLMAIPPWTPQPEKARTHFRKLANLRKQCEDILQAPLPVLSMGMSSDFEIAIEEGSTMIRVGTGIFGERGRSTA